MNTDKSIFTALILGIYFEDVLGWEPDRAIQELTAFMANNSSPALRQYILSTLLPALGRKKVSVDKAL